MSRDAAPMLHVRVVADGVAETLALPLVDRLTLGREIDCDIALPSDTVSRRHLSIHVRAGCLIVHDHSSNGTLVDGAHLHLEKREVGRATRLTLGPYTLQLTLDVEPPTSVSAAVRRRLRAALLDGLDLVAIERAERRGDALRPRVLDALARVMDACPDPLPVGAARIALRDELCDEVLGLGPLEPLLRDSSISEIMLVDARTIYVERAGRIERASAAFTDDTAVRAAIERIVTPLGRRIDESSPIVDARLQDGSRVNAVIPPLALRGPCITIRKFPQKRLTLDDLIARASLSSEMARFLARAVRVRANLVIAGGTGSGKTTLLNVLSAAIPGDERIVTIEDAAELSLAQPHVVALEARPPNMEGAGAVTIRELLKNALRMRPDRIVVGECRGGEALDMLQAMNTGHDGSMTTCHANSPSEAVQRLETLCLMAGLDLPLTALRRQLGASVELIVQQARFADGARRITHITEVAGVDDRGEVELRDLFRFEQLATDARGQVEGEFVATGVIARCVERFVKAGLREERACS